nr:MAG TPA: hypothetical protein [Caudoviricetes sp.]
MIVQTDSAVHEWKSCMFPIGGLLAAARVDSQKKSWA